MPAVGDVVRIFVTDDVVLAPEPADAPTLVFRTRDDLARAAREGRSGSRVLSDAELALVRALDQRLGPEPEDVDVVANGAVYRVLARRAPGEGGDART